MELGRINRDRSGRVPRASRSNIFYQSCSAWNVPGSIETPIPQDSPVRPLAAYLVPEDMERGQGY